MMSTMHAAVDRVATGAAAAALAMVAAAALPAYAAQQRSFVASTGNDAAPCTLASPCRSFTVAVAHTNSGGEVIVLDSAGYGPTTITKPISLIAPAGVYAGITVAAGDGITVDAPGATVVLRGLAINGQGGAHGIRLHDAARVRIESCVISEMAQDGIHHEGAAAELAVLDTIVRDNGNFGINLVADASVVLDRVRSEHNETSGMHVGGVSGLASASVSDSVFSHNENHGIVVAGSNGQTTRLQVDRSTIAYNGGSGVLAVSAPSSTVNLSLSGDSINGNADTGVTLWGTAALTFVRGVLSANSVTANGNDGVYVHGIALAQVSANSMATNGSNDLHCDQGALIASAGNNLAENVAYEPAGCHTVVPTQ